ncbi:sigma 54-interacting transcriptional regulator [Lacimonas salitolerans]|uniref:Sigma 54-interacting transcriptional regulator n=1 Tax=Lacimonas salitolerans TaxID=1323750 RepID=A0ABW4EK48_9RHOB
MAAPSVQFTNFEAIAGSSPAVTQMRREIDSVSQYNVNVLTTGPTGAGKELVVQALHAKSGRKGKLICVNCAAIPRDLLEAELFGHEKGAFTGASTSRKGRFEDAAQGTLFLDEIGDMPLELQAKLLRVIETRKISRLGSNAERPVDFRLVCATHKNLGDKLHRGGFREDLLYRLSVVVIHVPPLSDRIQDIPELIVEISTQIENDGSDLVPPPVELDGMEELMRYDWPGNVRELKNFLQRAAIFSRGKPLNRSMVRRLLHLDERRDEEQAFLRNAIHNIPTAVDQTTTSEQHPKPFEVEKSNTSAIQTLRSGQRFRLKTHLENIELNYITTALELADSSVTRAAQMLSLKRTTLIAKMRKYGIFSEAEN